mmetsp:Transcript_117055/g.342869  ORF Transcript_117055/g.342869 Transcript_117055/m.342869 type:complete len:205 (+) Transcript_117055:267-881(+)
MRHDARQDEEPRLGTEVCRQCGQHRHTHRQGLLTAHQDDGHPLFWRQASGGGNDVTDEAVDQVDGCRKCQAERQVTAARHEDLFGRLGDHEENHQQDAAVLAESQLLLVARRELAQRSDEAPQGHAEDQRHEGQPDQLRQHLPGAHGDGSGEDLGCGEGHCENAKDVGHRSQQDRKRDVALSLSYHGDSGGQGCWNHSEECHAL